MLLQVSRRVFSAAAVVFAAAACSTLKHIPATTTVTGFDFTSYSAQGFMFTPEMYQGAYESRGVIYVTMTAEANLKPGKNGVLEWEYSPLGVQDVIAEAHKRAVALGADALVNFSIRAAPATRGTMIIPGIEVSGFAIKRLGQK